MKKNNIFVSTYPFGSYDKTPIDLLTSTGWNITYNPYKRKLTTLELINLITPYDAIIAGTENITKEVLDNAPHLKIISRVGIGLDSVDLKTTQEKGIIVTYTPDAPTKAVGELTIGLILTLARHITSANNNLKNNIWQRLQGIRLENKTIGILGVGRIGKYVIELLQPFNPKIIANDINPDISFGKKHKIDWVTKEEIYKQSDIISVHVPLSKATKNLIGKKEFALMKNTAILINTARGDIVNEKDLYDILKDKKINSAAMDVFEEEPYNGELKNLDNIILTPHIGSCSFDCRARMETEATQSVIDFFNKKKISNIVPETEYKYQIN